MQVIFQGEQNSDETAESVANIIKLFQERYGIHQFREFKLSMVLMDEQGDDIELVDSRTSEVFRILKCISLAMRLNPFHPIVRQC